MLHARLVVRSVLVAAASLMLPAPARADVSFGAPVDVAARIAGEQVEVLDVVAEAPGAAVVVYDSAGALWLRRNDPDHGLGPAVEVSDTVKRVGQFPDEVAAAAVDASGTLTVVWSTQDGHIMTRSVSPDDTLSGAQTLAAAASGPIGLAVAPSGAAVAGWVGGGTNVVSRPAGGTFGTPVNVPGESAPAVAIGPDGTGWIVSLAGTDATVKLRRVTTATGAVGPAITAATKGTGDDDALFRPHIAADAAGTVWIEWDARTSKVPPATLPTEAIVVASKSSADDAAPTVATQFSKPYVTGQGFEQLLADGAGNVAVSWWALNTRVAVAEHGVFGPAATLPGTGRYVTPHSLALVGGTTAVGIQYEYELQTFRPLVAVRPPAGVFGTPMNPQGPFTPPFGAPDPSTLEPEVAISPDGTLTAAWTWTVGGPGAAIQLAVAHLPPTPTPTPTPTPSPTPSVTPTATPTPTPTAVPTVEPTPSAVVTPVPLGSPSTPAIVPAPPHRVSAPTHAQVAASVLRSLPTRFKARRATRAKVSVTEDGTLVVRLLDSRRRVLARSAVELRRAGTRTIVLRPTRRPTYLSVAFDGARAERRVRK